MVIALPFYWLNRLRPSRKQLYQIIATAFLLSIAINQLFKDVINYISQTLNILTAYTGDSEMAEGSGMLNPMIYFQLITLLLL